MNPTSTIGENHESAIPIESLDQVIQLVTNPGPEEKDL